MLRPLRYPPIQTTRPGVVRLRIPAFIKAFANTDFLLLPQRRVPTPHLIEGRIGAVRKAGRAMYFIDVWQDNAKVQLVASNTLMNMSKDQFNAAHQDLRKGDSIGAVGFPSSTNVGELSLKLDRPVTMLLPNLHSATMPDKLVDRSSINSHRVLNYLVSQVLRNHIAVRSYVVQALRAFLLERDFLEVLTPIIGGPGTGANAEPFVTALRALGPQPLHLRVAPELWLKKYVIGGFDKVFEIGPSFRNEGIDATHNPEFTSCEFYQAFTSLPELMQMTEELFQYIHRALQQRSIPVLRDTLARYPFTEFKRYEFVPTLEQATGVPLPPPTSANLIEYHHQIGLALPKVRSPASLLDNLSAHYLEPLSLKHKNTPVFIYNQPAALLPLAKSQQIAYNGASHDISLRFELFINGKEYVNAYEEENSPHDQRAKFHLQLESRASHADADAIVPDWHYVELMEYGLPPTGGWGCGIDRLAMLFAGTDRIEDVLAFGNLRDVTRQ